MLTAPRLEKVREKIAASLDEMMARISFCIATELDEELRQVLRNCAACNQDEPLYVLPSGSRAWMALDDGQPVRLVSDAPSDACRLVVSGLEADDDLWGAIVTSIARTQASSKAWDLISPIFDARVAPTVNQIKNLLDRAPVIETIAYELFTTSSLMLEGQRLALLSPTMSVADRDAMLVEYWLTLHRMGHLLTIASSPTARPWLADMATNNAWRDWTPTFLLTRERTLWLMAIAAKSAIAFGESVVDIYLARLAGRKHPLDCFDALVGLVAIGLDRPDIAAKIVNEIDRAGQIAQRHLAQSSQVWFMLNCAMQTLVRPDVSEKRFDQLVRKAARLELAHPKLLGLDAVRLDPTEAVPRAGQLGLIALPHIARTPLGSYYPRRSTPGFVLRPLDISKIVRRAWGVAASKHGSSTLH